MSSRSSYSRQPQEVRRLALIEATIDALAELGLGGVSVRNVAVRAGVSPSLLNHYYPSFASLLAEAYAHSSRKVEAALDAAVEAAGDAPEKRLDAFLTANFAPPIADRDLLAAWLGFWGLVRRDPSARKVHAKTYAAYRTRVEGLLADVAAARHVVIDARASAIALSALMDGLWLELCLDPTTFTPEEASRLAKEWTQGMFAATR